MCVCVIQTDEITQHEQFKNSSTFDVNITHKTMPNLQEITRVKSPHQSPPKKKLLASSSVAVLAMPGDQTITSLVLFISKFELLYAIIHESKSSGMLKLWQTEGQYQPTGTN